MGTLPTHESEIVAALRSPTAYSEATARVEIVDTHISWVFLTDRRAYKLKKPVRFDFLDFSTRERREADCREEVRLNRRLAPDVYVGVSPITRDGGVRIDGTGEPLDWVVVMRRLDATTSLDRLFAAQRLSPPHIASLADLLARFYAAATPAAITPAEYVRELQGHVRANRTELLDVRHALSPWLVRRVHAAQLTLLDRRRDWFDARVTARRVVDGHGDLRPEHIYFDPAPEIIDCVEFNAEYRRVDVLDELCFLAEECDALGAGEVGAEVLTGVCRRLSDPPRPELVAWYKSYRACVRAKVAALRSEQETGPGRTTDLVTATRYLEAAGEYLPTKPFVVVVCGTMGAGKSTIAAALADRWGAELIRTDVVRRELYGDDDQPLGFAAGRYSPEARQSVYAEVARRAELAVNESVPVILDGGYLTDRDRQTARAVAEQSGLELLFIECCCPQEIATARIASRLRDGHDASEARPELLVKQAAQREPFRSADRYVELDTTQAHEQQLERAIAHWRGL